MDEMARPVPADDDALQAAAQPDESSLEPTQAEIDAWVVAERARREAWLKGPTEEERDAYASRLRQRRVAEAFDAGESRIDAGMRQGLHYGREGQLAVEGAMAILYRWSRRTLTELVKAGRDWESETTLPSRRRRVPFDDDPT